LNYNALYDNVYSLFAEKASKNFLYHSWAHTAEVIQNTDEIGRKENITDIDLIILKSAALLHDVGYLTSSKDHEEVSCFVARDLLPRFEYSEEEIGKICELIMTTKLPQQPKDLLGKVLCDADLYYLGGDDYKPKAKSLYLEMKNFGNDITEHEWIDVQLAFLKNHKYFTPFAVENRSEGKGRIINELEKTKKGIMTKKEPRIILSKYVQFMDFLLLMMGVIVASLGLKLFLVPNHFFDGGVTGMSLLIHEIMGINLALVTFCLNLPFIIVGYFSVSKHFAWKTLMAVTLFCFFLLIVPASAATTDKLLIAIFGGAFLGVGIGCVMRTGAALDGIEVLALYTLKKTSFSIAEIILGINIIIFSIAGFFFGIETALYSILTYFTASRTINYVVEGLQSYTGVTIISANSEEVKNKLVNTLGRGITIYKGERGFLPGKFEEKMDCDIIFTVITRLELRKLTNIVTEIDEKAFIFASTIREAKGGILKRIHKH
jgi:uncharacterized membrane-anchored protein YitT (DUF2179 family)/predicted metal-dependent HD superfamily phosphohydrolase